jgi:hypothetical protein
MLKVPYAPCRLTQQIHGSVGLPDTKPRHWHGSFRSSASAMPCLPSDEGPATGAFRDSLRDGLTPCPAARKRGHIGALNPLVALVVLRCDLAGVLGLALLFPWRGVCPSAVSAARSCLRGLGSAWAVVPSRRPFPNSVVRVALGSLSRHGSAPIAGRRLEVTPTARGARAPRCIRHRVPVLVRLPLYPRTHATAGAGTSGWGCCSFPPSACAVRSRSLLSSLP